MISILLIKLLIAHVLGDFVFQPSKWVEGKRKNTYKSKYFYFHGLIHLFALIVLLGFDWSYWLSILILVGSHLLIDLIKINLDKRLNTRLLFAMDQILHILVIIGVVYINEPFEISLRKINSPEILLSILVILFITFVSSILMKVLMGKWVMKEDKTSDSLKNAGQYIGVLERLFIFIFIILDQWSAIGLLITAKSVFRFSDLSRAKDRKLTEYILIGTLMSFGIAIITGLLYLYLIKQI
ncbi:DUF3307 domain-containing protein [Psychroflexus halocasei]|uniref:DUF3307 domain-containing protein n=1 Tax=Psychroflexus halocasei TaxID=908615 RepID=A0A1H3ZVF3_9FLAO|nr:DUF3307 domain-containing protein [Psychroflexus halocasei]SEA27756.1 Protein of unknown function [Psychroflexus halocasei]